MDENEALTVTGSYIHVHGSENESMTVIEHHIYIWIQKGAQDRNRIYMHIYESRSYSWNNIYMNQRSSKQQGSAYAN